MSTQTGLDAITAQFETRIEDMPRISTSSSKPTYTSIKIFQEVIDANAMSISSFTTELGHLALTRKASEVKTANGGTSFIEPTSPGTAPAPPTRITTRASAAALALDPSATGYQTTDPFLAQEAIRIFSENQRQYTRYCNAKIALRNCIIKSVDDEYIKVLKHTITRYAKVSPLTILNHLWATYGEVGINDLKANADRMKIPWNPPTPIETLFLQLEVGKDFAKEGGEVIDDSHLVRLGYDNVAATGQFTKYCTKWRKRLPVDRTWAHFRTVFTEYDKERTDSMTADEASYSINQVQEMIDVGIENKLAAWTQQYADDNVQPYTPPTPPPSPPAHPAANALSENDLVRLATILQGNNTNGIDMEKLCQLIVNELA